MLVFFAYVFRYYVFVFFGLHIILLTIPLYISLYKDSDLNLFTRLFRYMTNSYCIMFHMSRHISKFFCSDFRDRRLFMFLYEIVLCLENFLRVSLAVWHAPAGTTHNKR